MNPTQCQLNITLASHLRAVREELTQRWLDRIAARVTLSRNDVFPTADLLNHVPLLIEGIAGYLEQPGDDIDTEVPVTAKARELGAMRYAQGFDVFQILKEYELLGAVIAAHLTSVVDELAADCTPADVAACWTRLGQAVEHIRQATTTHFLQLSDERVREREDRLRRFNRMVSHELKSHVSAIRGAGALLEESWLDPADQPRFVRMVRENAEELQRVLETLVQLSRLESDARQQHNVLLPHAATEVARQLREMAEARHVEIHISPDLPSVEVNAAALEICLRNFVSNGIKYADPARRDRWVAVEAHMLAPGASPIGGELVVRVRDNGLGVPFNARERLFRQFYRAHGETVTDVEGTGLGLSIVRETVELLGGRAWAEFPPEGGSIFAFSLPSRRGEDSAAAGVTRTP